MSDINKMRLVPISNPSKLRENMDFHQLSTWKLLQKLEKDFDVIPRKTDFIKESSSVISSGNCSVKSSKEFTDKSLIGSASCESSTAEVCNDVNNINSKSTESAQEISTGETNNWAPAVEPLFQESDFVKKSHSESLSKGEKSNLGSVSHKSLTSKDGVSNKEKTEISKRNVSKIYAISKEGIVYLREKKKQDSCSAKENSSVNIDANTDVSKSSPCKKIIGNVSKNRTSEGYGVLAGGILNKVIHLVTPFGSNKEIIFSNSGTNRNKQINFVSDKNSKNKLVAISQRKPLPETRRSFLKATFRGGRYVIKPYYQPYRDRLFKYAERNAAVKTALKSHDKKCGPDVKKLPYVPENLKYFGGLENRESVPEDHPWFSWISDCENGFPKDVFRNPMVDKWTNTDEDLEKNYRGNNLLGKKSTESSSSQTVSAEEVKLKKIPVKISHLLIDRVPPVSNQKIKSESPVL